MESLRSLWHYVLEHPLEVVGLIVAYYSFFLPIRHYLNQRKLEEEDKRFNNYHRLIKEMVQGGGPGETYLDRQIAVVFELRNYKEYYPVTERILLGLCQTWANCDVRILNEINLTLAFIARWNGKFPQRVQQWYTNL